MIGDFILKLRYGRRYNELYNVACDRHQGDLEIWRQMNKSNKSFKNIEKEIRGCCGKLEKNVNSYNIRDFTKVNLEKIREHSEKLKEAYK